jgi:hypothetical protein
MTNPRNGERKGQEMKSRLRPLVILMVMALVTAACGDG